MPEKQSNQNQLNNENEEEEIKGQNEEILDFNNPSFSFIPNGRHVYRQRGYYLICGSCELEHANWIGPDKLMIGEDENGKPIVKKRSEI